MLVMRQPPPEPAHGPAELLIADAGVQDLDVLLAGLAPSVQPWLLGPGEDAAGVIATALAMPGLRRLHVLAHGVPGGVVFDGKVLGAAAFSPHQPAAITGRQSALDIAFWCCRTGAGAAGLAFAWAVAQANRASVAAASGLVGAASKNGSWDLDIWIPAPMAGAHAMSA